MKDSGEQLSGKIESKKPDNRYDVFRRYAKMIADIMEHCSAVKEQKFEYPEDMEDATYSIASRWGEELLSYQKLAGDIPVRVTGEGVHIPHVSLQAATNEQNVGVFVGVQDDEGQGVLHPLPMFESKTGYIQSLLARPNHDLETDTYSTSFHFLIRDKALARLSFSDPTSGLPLITAQLQKYFIADCSEHTEIEFPATEHVDARNQSIKALAQSGIRSNRFISEIQKVSAAFYDNDSDDLQDMKSVDRLRWIARKAEQLAAEGACSPDVISNALLSMFGKHRTFEVEGLMASIGQSDMDKEKSSTEPSICEGEITDVFMYQDDEHGMTPVLALNDTYEEDEIGKVKYFLLREVQTVKF